MSVSTVKCKRCHADTPDIPTKSWDIHPYGRPELTVKIKLYNCRICGKSFRLGERMPLPEPVGVNPT